MTGASAAVRAIAAQRANGHDPRCLQELNTQLPAASSAQLPAASSAGASGGGGVGGGMPSEQDGR